MSSWVHGNTFSRRCSADRDSDQKSTVRSAVRENLNVSLKSNTCGLVRGYDGFEIIESSPQTTAVPGNEGGHECAALAPPLELEVDGPD
ncbi:hypothetical protein TNCV_3125901 [Trichonephila clavipes]|nr:hypothetical protein TNCV_3125901 [Trichonephila clavipes]